MGSEADTCRKWIVPKLQAAGWDNEPHSIAEQRTITDGRIVPVGKGFVRKSPKRADYILRYERNFPLAVVEAKPDWKTAGAGLQQAKDYAELLQLKFAYASNGQEIIEFDYFTGQETVVHSYPTPAELWARYSAAKKIPTQAGAQMLTPMNHLSGKGERYYQEIAVNRAVEGILTGQRRSCSPWPRVRARPPWRFKSAGSFGAPCGTARNVRTPSPPRFPSPHPMGRRWPQAG